MKKAILISVPPKWVEKILNGEKTIEIRKSMPKCDLPIDVYIYCSKGDVNLYKEFIQLWNDNNSNNLIKPYYESTSYFVGKQHLKEYDIKTSSRTQLNGEVVAKFTLNKVEHYQTAYVNPKSNQTYRFTKYGLFINEDKFDYTSWEKNENVEKLLKKSCLIADDIHKYAKTGKLEDLDYGYFYAWHIENLQIFDKSMELNEFYKGNYEYIRDYEGCNLLHCLYARDNSILGDDGNCDDCPRLKVNKAPQSWQYVYVVD